jgi:hypothetical protein
MMIKNVPKPILKHTTAYFKLTLAIAFITSLLACSPGTTTKTDQLEEITSRTDTTEGFSDIYLKIISDQSKDSVHIYLAKGLHNGKTVGIQLEVKSNMPAGLTPEGGMGENGFIQNPVTFLSIGKESNELLKALSELYKVPTTNLFAKQVTASSGFSLNQKIADLNVPGHYKFKLFFESETDVPELYFNVNTAEGIIELFEKDPEYRSALLDVFSKTGK